METESAGMHLFGDLGNKSAASLQLPVSIACTLILHPVEESNPPLAFTGISEESMQVIN